MSIFSYGVGLTRQRLDVKCMIVVLEQAKAMFFNVGPLHVYWRVSLWMKCSYYSGNGGIAETLNSLVSIREGCECNKSSSRKFPVLVDRDDIRDCAVMVKVVANVFLVPAVMRCHYQLFGRLPT